MPIFKILRWVVAIFKVLIIVVWEKPLNKCWLLPPVQGTVKKNSQSFLLKFIRVLHDVKNYLMWMWEITKFYFCQTKSNIFPKSQIQCLSLNVIISSQICPNCIVLELLISITFQGLISQVYPLCKRFTRAYHIRSYLCFS